MSTQPIALAPEPSNIAVAVSTEVGAVPVVENSTAIQEEDVAAVPTVQRELNDPDNVIIREEEPGDLKGYVDKTNYDVYNVRREGYFFENEVKVDGETIFTIPLEEQLEEQSEKLKRTSRWGDRPQRRKKQQVNLLFNPLQAMTKGYGLLQITAEGYKPGDQFKAVDEEEEKVSRWGPEFEKTFHPPLLNFIPQNITDDELEYLIRLYRLDEIHYKSMNRSTNVLDDEDCRSVSPPPVYNDQGKRINTRDVRENEAIQKEKSNLIEEAMRINPTFIPPHDYRIQKKQKKIYLPEQNAELLKQKVIGLKGATHKKLEQETGCKISIKGKGASHGLKRIDNDVNEKLHILIQASLDEEIEKAASMIEEILRGEEKEEPTVASNQVAIISEYLNENFCSKCHQTGHRSWECNTKTTFSKVEVKCDICGDKGHITSDCKFKREYSARQKQAQKEEQTQGNMNTQFQQFVTQIEGNQSLLNTYGRPLEVQPQRPAITGTSFITDNVVIDPNMLMIKYGDSLPPGITPSASSGPSGPSFDFSANRTRTAYDTYVGDRPPQANNANNAFTPQQPPAQQQQPHHMPAPMQQVAAHPMQMPPVGYGAPPQMPGYYGANPYGYYPPAQNMGYYPGYGMPAMNPYYGMQQHMYPQHQQMYQQQPPQTGVPGMPQQPQLPPAPPG